MADQRTDGGFDGNLTTRTFRPRRGLPNGRAVVGALLVTVAAVGTFFVTSRSGDEVDPSYAVVARRVQSGTQLQAEDVRLEPMRLAPASAALAVQSLTEVEAATARRDLEVGQLLSRHDLIAASAIEGEPVGAVHELALAVPRERIAARTAVGDRVTVLITLSGDLAGGDRPVTVVAVEDALVLGWATSDSLSGSSVLTLALEDAGSTGGLAHMALLGEVTVVRTTQAVRDEYPAYFQVPEIALPSASEVAP